MTYLELSTTGRPRGGRPSPLQHRRATTPGGGSELHRRTKHFVPLARPRAYGARPRGAAHPRPRAPLLAFLPRSFWDRRRGRCPHRSSDRQRGGVQCRRRRPSSSTAPPSPTPARTSSTSETGRAFLWGSVWTLGHRLWLKGIVALILSLIPLVALVVVIVFALQGNRVDLGARRLRVARGAPPEGAHVGVGVPLVRARSARYRTARRRGRHVTSSTEGA